MLLTQIHFETTVQTGIRNESSQTIWSHSPMSRIVKSTETKQTGEQEAVANRYKVALGNDKNAPELVMILKTTKAYIFFNSG